MKCLHCGYCCIMLDVIIIKPEYIDESVDFENQDIYIHKPYNVKCPHLFEKDNKYYCKIHEYDWYKETPCYSHTQIEQGNKVCRMGKYLLQDKQKDLYNRILSSPNY